MKNWLKATGYVLGTIVGLGLLIVSGSISILIPTGIMVGSLIFTVIAEIKGNLDWEEIERESMRKEIK